ncbi:MAG TPA: ABC transporter permease [Blastocatellia bacterium]|nr:ABC transporter permease [Blastocatellia bacterium]
MESLLQDLRYGVRMLLKKPGFTVVAVLTLALGIGANTAIFSFMNSLFLRPLPFAEPDQLVRLYGEDSEGRRFDVFSYANYVDIRDRSQSFAGLAAHDYVSVNLSTGAGAESVQGEIVTGNYFSMLGANAMAGRTLLDEDDSAPGAHPVVVISHRLWQRRFGASPNAVGAKIYLNGHPFTIVGVMPEEFRGAYQAIVADFWAPMMMHEQVRPRGTPITQRSWGWLNGTGRLKPNVTREQAQAEIAQIAGQLEQEYPQVNKGMRFELLQASALPEQFGESVSGLLGFFMGVVLLVLLVACANIASLLLSRVMARRPELAIRQSLGATRGRLMQQWLTESLLLAVLGGAAGLLVAIWMSEGLMSLVPPDFEEFSPALSLDVRVLGFTFLVSLLTGVGCGLLPALRASKTDVISALKEGSATASGSVLGSRLQQVFVVAQMAVCSVLLIVAGLLLRSLQESASFNPGFNSDNMLLATVDLSRNGYSEAQGRNFYRQLTERLRSLPGASEATFAIVVPLGTSKESRGYIIPGHVPAPGRTYFSIHSNVVGPEYFTTMGIPLLSGREFDARDAEAGARPVVIINETMAKRFWPDQDPVGRSVQMKKDGPAIEIIGVARDIKYYSLGEEPLPYVYGSFAQFYSPSVTLQVRTAGDPKSLMRALQKEVEGLDPNVAIRGLTTLADLRQVPLFPSRAMAMVSSLFGLLAVGLTALGLYGILSYSVSQRKREVGIRMALGAQAADIFKLIIRQGLTITLIGIGIGLIGSLALTRFLSSLLFGISPTDPLTFAVIAVSLLGVALVACFVPARRATKVDPMIALRHE